jgi:uncharacterized protein (DUF952 family)
VTIIIHIAGRKQWESAVIAGEYRGDTLDSEGFIHCSYPRQVLGPANAFFRRRRDLVLLRIDPKKVTSEIRVEPGAASPKEAPDHFPRIYGPLNLDAVVKVIDFSPGEDGTFTLPLEIDNLEV